MAYELLLTEQPKRKPTFDEFVKYHNIDMTPVDKSQQQQQQKYNNNIGNGQVAIFNTLIIIIIIIGAALFVRADYKKSKEKQSLTGFYIRTIIALFVLPAFLIPFIEVIVSNL